MLFPDILIAASAVVNNCGVVTFPAQNSCAACSGTETEEIELERRGKLWTYTIQCFLFIRPPYDGPETPENFKPFPAKTNWQTERAKMKEVCTQCHGKTWVDDHYIKLASPGISHQFIQSRPSFLRAAYAIRIDTFESPAALPDYLA